MTLANVVKDFGKSRIAVLGDFCLDLLLHGKHKGFSRESPAPVNRINKLTFYPGAAANVAYNLLKMGVGKVFPVAVVGNYGEGVMSFNFGDALVKTFEDAGANCSALVKSERPTYAYLKNMATGEGTSTPEQQTYRCDFGNDQPITKELEDKIIAKLKSIVNDVDIIVVSDYGKGMITPRILDAVKEIFKNKIIIGTARNDIKKLKGFTVLCLNEYETMLPYEEVEDRVDDKKLHETAKKLISELGLKNLIVTRGEKGVTVYNHGGEAIDIPTKPKKVVDITGAGDTAIAAVVASVGTGADYVTACKISNFAAGLVVEKAGTATITNAELIEEILKNE